MILTFVQKNDYKGLKVAAPCGIASSIGLVVGKNGSGKSRLLEALVDGSVQAYIDDVPVEQNKITLIKLDDLRPRLNFEMSTQNAIQNKDEFSKFYFNNKNDFSLDSTQFDEKWHRRGRDENISVTYLYEAACVYADANNKDILNLNEYDISQICHDMSFNFYSGIDVSFNLSTYQSALNANETARIWKNENSNSNQKYISSEEFENIYGPKPWLFLNDVLSKFLNDLYISEPLGDYDNSYKASLLSRSSGKAFDQLWLSSGEKIILALATYTYRATLSGSKFNKPKLILFDEPDAFLHPSMVKILYQTLILISERFNCKILIATHSPTTVALCSEECSIINMTPESATIISKDDAISNLLFGVQHVAVLSNNRRQIYVESFKDAFIYQELFDFLYRSERLILSEISLSFIPSGAKVDESTLRNFLVKHFSALDETSIENYIREVNGVGNDTNVIANVDNLVREGCHTVFGIIDWDGKNRRKGKILVHAPGEYYSLENAILNPVNVGFFLLFNHAERYRAEIMGLDTRRSLADHLADESSWQIIANFVSEKVLGTSNADPKKYKFVNNFCVNFNPLYTMMNGHELETKIRDAFLPLKAKQYASEKLMKAVLSNFVFAAGWGASIPECTLDMFNIALS